MIHSPVVHIVSESGCQLQNFMSSHYHQFASFYDIRTEKLILISLDYSQFPVDFLRIVMKRIDLETFLMFYNSFWASLDSCA